MSQTLNQPVWGWGLKKERACQHAFISIIHNDNSQSSPGKAGNIAVQGRRFYLLRLSARKLTMEEKRYKLALTAGFAGLGGSGVASTAPI